MKYKGTPIADTTCAHTTCIYFFLVPLPARSPSPGTVLLVIQGMRDYTDGRPCFYSWTTPLPISGHQGTQMSEVGLVTLAGEEGDKHIEMSPEGRGHSDRGRAGLWVALLMNGNRGLYESFILSLVFSTDIYFYLFKYTIQAQKCFGSPPKLPTQEN